MVDVSTQFEILSDGLNLSDDQKAQLLIQMGKLQAYILNQIEMDKATEGIKLTNAGKALIGKALTGKEIHYTRVSVGDGLFEGTESDLRKMTALISPRMDLPISNLRHNGGGTVTLTYNLDNAQIEEGFWNRELGVFATDPDTGEEVLYCYRNSGTATSFVPAGNGAVVVNLTISVILVVDQATNITAVIDANLAYVSQVEFTNHINSANPHPNTPRHLADVTTTNAFWVTQDDNHLHRMSYEDTKRLILGDAAATIPMLTQRVNQLEVNQANILMRMLAEDELGAEVNLLIYEDFKDTSQVDGLKIRVISSAKGDDTIELETDKDVIMGSNYWITDGISQEYICVSTMIRNGSRYRLLAKVPLENTYDNDSTYIYRTTSTSTGDGKVTGAGDTRGFALNSTLIYRGAGSNTTTILTLETTQTNADAFKLTDDGGFTADGSFTLIA